MSEWNSIENRLRTWIPRQPSPELQRRLFRAPAGPQASAVAPISRLADFSRWLVPAVGCFLLVTATLSNRYSPREGLADSAENIFLAHSDQAGEMYLARHPDHSDINNIPARRWEWRLTTPAVTPAIASIFFSYTNKSTTNE